MRITLDDLQSPERGRVLRQTLTRFLNGTFELVEGASRGELLPTFRHGASAIDFKLIPSGEFLMGLSDWEEACGRRIRDPMPVNAEEMRPVRRIAIDALYKCFRQTRG
jgi:hypothetical protein